MGRGGQTGILLAPYNQVPVKGRVGKKSILRPRDRELLNDPVAAISANFFKFGRLASKTDRLMEQRLLLNYCKKNPCQVYCLTGI